MRTHGAQPHRPGSDEFQADALAQERWMEVPRFDVARVRRELGRVERGELDRVFVHNKPLVVAGGSKIVPNFVHFFANHGVVVQIDQNLRVLTVRRTHSPDEECTKMTVVTMALLDMFPEWNGVYFLRVNPGPYQVDGVTQDTPLPDRLAGVRAFLDKHSTAEAAARLARKVEEGKPRKPAMIARFMYYDAVTKDGVRMPIVVDSMGADSGVTVENFAAHRGVANATFS